MIDQGHIQEANDRTQGPFTAVIERYKLAARKTAARTKLKPATRKRRRTKIELVTHSPRVKAVIFYLGTVNQLEAING